MNSRNTRKRGQGRRRQTRRQKIAFQGELGANSHIACDEAYPGYEALPCPTFEDAFAAVRTGRAELKGAREQHRGMERISGGDIDVDVEQAYFSGDEAPGGDNPTPDQEVVDEIGGAIGVEYQDNEELGTTEKVSKRDKHRWELDPASAEDYKERR